MTSRYHTVTEAWCHGSSFPPYLALVVDIVEVLPRSRVRRLALDVAKAAGKVAESPTCPNSRQHLAPQLSVIQTRCFFTR